MLTLFKTLKRFLPFLPYLLIGGVCLYFIHSYSSLQSTNMSLENTVRETQQEVIETQQELQDIQHSYAKQQELIELREELSSDLEAFRTESHRRTIDYLTTSKEIGNAIQDDVRSVLHPDVKRMLDNYREGDTINP